MALTPKQEAFCLAYLETGNASEAYRRAYDAVKMAPATINRKAKALIDDGKIAARLAELRAPAVEAAQLTLQAHLEDLKELREQARKSGNFGPAVQAEISRGRAAGFYTERIKIEDERDHMTDDELRRRVLDRYLEFGINGPGKPVTH